MTRPDWQELLEQTRYEYLDAARDAARRLLETRQSILLMIAAGRYFNNGRKRKKTAMTDTKDTSPIPGISLRDWFAGQALAGMCAAPAMEGETWKDFATRAYLAADTMLLVREQTDD